MKLDRALIETPAPNLGLAQSGHCLVGKCLQNSKLCGSWQMCVSPACAKPQDVRNNGIAAQWIIK